MEQYISKIVNGHLEEWRSPETRVKAFKQLDKLANTYDFAYIATLATTLLDRINYHVDERKNAAKELKRQLTSSWPLIQKIQRDRWCRKDKKPYFTQMVERIFGTLEDEIDPELIELMQQTVSAVIAAQFTTQPTSHWKALALGILCSDNKATVKVSQPEEMPSSSGGGGSIDMKEGVQQMEADSGQDDIDPSGERANPPPAKRSKTSIENVHVQIAALRILESLPGPLCADNDELDELVEQVFGIILPPISHENLVDFRTLSLNHIARIVRENPISLQEGTIFSICNGLAKNNLLATTDEKICTSSLKLLIEIFSKKHIKDYVDPAITKLVTHFDWLEYYENKSPAVCQLLEDLFNKLNIVNQD